MINNMMIGHKFLKEEFEFTPTIGWDIDTFGHSDTNTRLYAEMGFDAMFFSRLDGEEKAQRQGSDRAMTFLWRPGQKDFGNQHQILTHVFTGDYCYPQGFFSGESFESDDAFISDETLQTFNAPDKMAQFVNYVQQQYGQRRG